MAMSRSFGLVRARLAGLAATGRPADARAFYLADGDPEIDAMMSCVAAGAGPVGRIEVALVSSVSFAETSAIADRAVATAKKPSTLQTIQRMKRALYARQYNWARRFFAARPGAVAIAWNGLTSSRYAFMEGARHAGAPRLYLERAPLPGRVTLDPAGINALNSVPRDRAAFEAWAEGDPDRRGDGWRRLKDELTARASTRPDVGQGTGATLGSGPFLFCPLQVPNDTQIRQFGGWAGTVEGQIRAIAQAAALLPPGWHLRIKEHPSSRIAFTRLLADLAGASDGRLVVDNATDTFAQLAASRGVITINSSVGLQAFFFDQPVIVLGQAFYGQPGLVTVADSEAAMRAAFAAPETLTFDAGFRAVFMNYLDRVYYPEVRWQDGRAVIDPAQIADKLAQARALAGKGA